MKNLITIASKAPIIGHFFKSLIVNSFNQMHQFFFDAFEI